MAAKLFGPRSLKDFGFVGKQPVISVWTYCGGNQKQTGLSYCSGNSHINLHFVILRPINIHIHTGHLCHRGWFSSNFLLIQQLNLWLIPQDWSGTSISITIICLKFPYSIKTSHISKKNWFVNLVMNVWLHFMHQNNFFFLKERQGVG